MDCLFGITGRDFVLLAADTLVARSIVAMKHDQQKIRSLGHATALAYCGEAGDAVAFAELMQQLCLLHETANDRQLSPKAAATYTRRMLADSLRSRDAYQVNLLIGGHDAASDSAALYWIDHLGAMAAVPYGAHGYGAYFCLSLLDRYYSPGMSVEEATELLKKCFLELKTRFIANITAFTVQLISKNGVTSSSVSL